MLGSLRVRLPLIFLAGIVLAGVVTTAISIRLFQDFAHDQTLGQLTSEGNGIAQLYQNAIDASYGNTGGDRAAPTFAAKNLETATGDKIFWIGAVEPFPGQQAHLTPLPQKTIEWTSGRRLTFDLSLGGVSYLAVANP